MENKKVRFIVYSDIHYDKLAARCITLEDCINIESSIMRKVESEGFDFTLFCGDRFLKREPEDEVKTRADKLLAEWVKNNNKPHFNLIGNHDWINNSMKWHTSKSLSHSIADGLIINMDHPTVYTGWPEVSLPVMIFAVPSGGDMLVFDDMNHIRQDVDILKLMVFHDIVSGSYVDDDEKHMFNDGLHISAIDRKEFDVVFGGDVHVPQMLPFKNTIGGYVGSVMQRTRVDANRSRGWLEVESTFDGNRWNTDWQFVESRGFFFRCDIRLDENDKFENVTNKMDEEDEMFDKFLEIRLYGSKSDIDRVLGDDRWDNFRNYLNVRGIDFTKIYDVSDGLDNSLIVNMSESHTIQGDLDLYLDSGFVNLGEITKQSLMNKLDEMMIEEK